MTHGWGNLAHACRVGSPKLPQYSVAGKSVLSCCSDNSLRIVRFIRWIVCFLYKSCLERPFHRARSLGNLFLCSGHANSHLRIFLTSRHVLFLSRLYPKHCKKSSNSFGTSDLFSESSSSTRWYLLQIERLRMRELDLTRDRSLEVYPNANIIW